MFLCDVYIGKYINAWCKSWWLHSTLIYRSSISFNCYFAKHILKIFWRVSQYRQIFFEDTKRRCFDRFFKVSRISYLKSEIYRSDNNGRVVESGRCPCHSISYDRQQRPVSAWIQCTIMEVRILDQTQNSNQVCNKLFSTYTSLSTLTSEPALSCWSEAGLS